MARSDSRGFACCNGLYEHAPVVEGFRALRNVRGSPAHLREVWGP